MEEVRKPAAAGKYYPEGKKELSSSVKKYIYCADARKRNVYGIIAPHAGYAYSGETAAYSYKAINNKSFDCFILLGPNHTGYGNKISITSKNFETPLGIVETDKEFCSELIKKCGESDDAHAYEHCLEVQLPFIASIFKKAKIVPIVLSLDSYSECTELAKELEKTAKKLKRKICVIVSSDFTHYGPVYGFVPFSGNSGEVKKKMHEIDRKAISFIEQLKSKEFFEYSKNTTICGAPAIAVAIELCRRLGSKKASLLKYTTSGEISGDYSNAVGYASIVFE